MPVGLHTDPNIKVEIITKIRINRYALSSFTVFISEIIFSRKPAYLFCGDYITT